MTNLTNQKILSHEEMKKLDENEIKDYLSQLKEGWFVSPKPNGEGGEFLNGNTSTSSVQKLRKVFEFDDFVKAMEFVNKVADVAEKEGHHPDITIHYNKVEISLWSHFISGLSVNDFIMGAKIDNID